MRMVIAAAIAVIATGCVSIVAPDPVQVTRCIMVEGKPTKVTLPESQWKGLPVTESDGCK